MSDAPLVASHSNAHAICPTTRNLTDAQLARIRESGGLVGLNYATSFLRPDGQMSADTGLDVMLRHLDHLIEHLGEDGVGLGSDFDGATMPDDLPDVAALPTLVDALSDAGFDASDLERIGTGNWIRVLEDTWSA